MFVRGIIGAAALVGAMAEARAACTPAALVGGPADLVVPIRRALAARGITGEAVEGCPPLRADVAPNGSELTVTIEDPYGHVHTHAAANADAAATLIESWADVGQEEPLLAARDWARPVAPRAAVDLDTPSGLIVHQDPAPIVGLSAALEMSFGSDGSAWGGVAGASCVRLGRICVGAGARLAMDTRLAGSSERLETGRTALDLLLGIDVPAQWGGARVRWGAGVGVGWIRSTVAGTAGAIEIDSGGLRTEAHVRIDLPVRGRFGVELSAALNVSPIAHVATYMDEARTLAGEPRGFARVGVGLRFGAP